MERRKFLKLSALGTAVLAIPGAGFASLSEKQAIAGIIHQEFNYLQLDPKGVEQFVEDYLAKYPMGVTWSVRVRTLYLLKTSAKDSHIVSRFAKEYIMGTDFFLNKMDERKTVTYLGLYHPYVRPCANPFSAIYYPESPAV